MSITLTYSALAQRVMQTRRTLHSVRWGLGGEAGILMTNFGLDALRTSLARTSPSAFQHLSILALHQADRTSKQR